MSREAPGDHRRHFPIPNSLVFIFAFIILATVLTYLIPAGQYTRVFDQTSGQDIVIADSFQYIKQTPVNPFKMFVLIGEGFVNQAQIIFFILFAYGFVGALVKCGLFESLFGLIFKHGLQKKKIIIPIVMCGFGLLGSVAGIAEEIFALFPICIALAVALGYDEIVGGSMVYLAIFTGFASATTNPFTIGVAQKIAQVPLFSGIGYRVVCWFVFMSILIGYTMHYATKIKASPCKSLLYIPTENSKTAHAVTDYNKQMTSSQKLNAVVFIVVFSLTVIGALLWDWYLPELTALFIVGTLFIGIINRHSPNKIAEDFIQSASETTFSIVCIGLANVICYILNTGNITDTILHSLASVLNHTSGYISGILMLLIQNLLNFFIPSGPGQAAVSMPIMAPLADLCGLSRQTAVLAFQFGDGYSNLFWPTMVCMMCGIMKIPVTKWYRFVMPLFGLYFLAQVTMIVIAVGIGY